MHRFNGFIIVTISILTAWSVKCAPKSAAIEIACEDAVIAQAQELLALAQGGRDHRERGAFVVRNSAGDYSFEIWPFNAEYHRAVFEDAAPAGTVAIFHTHPNEREYPSTRDQALSVRLGLPVYVVTRWRLSKSDGFRVESMWTGNWQKRRSSRSVGGSCISVRPQETTGDARGDSR